MRIALSAAMAATFLAGATAEAATFNFTHGRGAQAQSLSFAADDLSLTVFGAIDHRGDLHRSGTVGHWSTGLGLLTSRRDNHMVDGNGASEALFFQFSETVRLTSVSFSYADRDDDFTLFTLSEDRLVDRMTAGVGFTGSSSSRYDFSDTWLSTLFGIGAPGRNDEFKISGLSVERIRTPDTPAAIPLPPAAALLIAGLGALGLLARRQRRSA